jgi:hypothetical protein
MLERNKHSCINAQEPFTDSLFNFPSNVGGQKIGHPVVKWQGIV